MADQAVARIEDEQGSAVARAESGSDAIMRMIERAVADPDFDVAKMESLLRMREQWEAQEARKAYVSAMTAFKAEAPRILKNKKAGFESKRTGGSTSYAYATLDNVVDQIAPILSKHGLSHAWKVDQGENGLIRVTCTVTHERGHSESVTLQAGADQSGSKNSIQAIGSTVSYLSRYTLLSITGLAAAGQDDDGRGGAEDSPITDEQKAELIDLIKRSESDVPKFLAYLKVAQEDGVDGIMQSQFATAKAALNAALAAKQKKGAI